ncbi:MAG: hypothetical protein NTZ63_04450 [Candidatus Omnitrophica bacterium]|nr:hypothetical protein [Candidatus Omnitrophota bacterium]
MLMKLVFNLRTMFIIVIFLMLSANLYADEKDSISMDKSNDYKQSYDSGKNSYTYNNTVATPSYDPPKTYSSPMAFTNSPILNNNNYVPYVPTVGASSYNPGLTNITPSGLIKIPDSNSFPVGAGAYTAGLDKNSFSYTPNNIYGSIDSNFVKPVDMVKVSDLNSVPVGAGAYTAGLDKNSYNYTPKIDNLSYGGDIITPPPGLTKATDLNSSYNKVEVYIGGFDSGSIDNTFINPAGITKVPDLNSSYTGAAEVIVPSYDLGLDITPSGLTKAPDLNSSYTGAPKVNASSYNEDLPDIVPPGLAKATDLNSGLNSNDNKVGVYTGNTKQPPIRGFWYPQTKADLTMPDNSVQTGLDSQLPDFRERSLLEQGVPDKYPIPDSFNVERLLDIILDREVVNPLRTVNIEFYKEEKAPLDAVSLAGILINIVKDPEFETKSEIIPYRAAQALLRMRDDHLYPEVRVYLDAVWPNQGEDNRKIALERYSDLLDNIANGLGVSPEALNKTKDIPLHYFAATSDNIASDSIKNTRIPGTFLNAALLIGAIRGNVSNANFWSPIESSDVKSSSKGGMNILQSGREGERFSDYFAAEAGHALFFSELGRLPSSGMAGETVDQAARLFVAASLGYEDEVINGNDSIHQWAEAFSNAEILAAGNAEAITKIDAHYKAAFAISYLLNDPEHPDRYYTPDQIARAVFQTALFSSGENDPRKLGEAFRVTAQSMYPDQINHIGSPN